MHGPLNVKFRNISKAPCSGIVMTESSQILTFFFTRNTVKLQMFSNVWSCYVYCLKYIAF